jgi:ribonucleotide monophosphatase NagD (HAD superfamily)
MEDISATAADRILCIGDSLENDIAGGRRAGLSTALVRSGILADLSDAQLADVYARYGATPDFVMPAFTLN